MVLNVAHFGHESILAGKGKGLMAKLVQGLPAAVVAVHLIICGIIRFTPLRRIKDYADIVDLLIDDCLLYPGRWVVGS